MDGVVHDDEPPGGRGVLRVAVPRVHEDSHMVIPVQNSVQRGNKNIHTHSHKVMLPEHKIAHKCTHSNILIRTELCSELGTQSHKITELRVRAKSNIVSRKHHYYYPLYP